MERHDDFLSRSRNGEREGAAKASRGQRTDAAIRKSRWPGWIWAVPIAAAAVVVWLVIRSVSTGGADITVQLPSAEGMSNQTNVTFRGVNVGKVKDIKLAQDQKSVVADIHIDGSAENDLASGTRFYLENAKPSLTDLSSLKSVISGPTMVMVPGTGAPTTHFVGIIGSPMEPLARPVTFSAAFSGSVGALKKGAPVMFHGFNVGEVAGVDLASDAGAGRVTAKVVLALDAARFHIVNGDSRQSLTELLGKLVQQGLRAQLVQDPPLVGAEQIALEIMPDAAPASLEMNGLYPEIPSTEQGGIQALIAKLGKLPVKQIGENVRSITAHVNSLVSSPKLNDTIAHVNRATVELDKVVHQAGPQVAPTIQDLRKTASELDAAAQSARQMLGGSVTAPEGNVQQSLRELTDASRAVRSLADYLDRHPEALIKGR